MENTKYSFIKLNSFFKKLSFRIGIFIFDACHSGNFRMKGAGKKINIAESFLQPTSRNIKGKAVLYSSTANEFSHEWEHFQNSVFTYHFVNALKGFGDYSEDNEVSLDEAYKYSYDQTVTSVNSFLHGKQTPGRQLDIQGEGDIILSKTDKCSTGILFGNEIIGKITIFDHAQNTVAQLFKEKKNKLIYPLKPGTYQIHNTQSQKTQQTKARLKGNKLVYIQKENFLNQSGLPFSLHIKSTVLRTNLFDFNKRMSDVRYEEFMAGLGIEFTTHYNLFLESHLFYSRFKNDLPQINLRIPSLVFHNGIGYKFSGLKKFNIKPLKFVSDFSLKAGIDIVHMDYTMYHKQSEDKIHGKGNLFFPFIGCDYNYPILHFLSCGPSIIYRQSIFDNKINTIFNDKLLQPVLPINRKMFEFGFFVRYSPEF